MGACYLINQLFQNRLWLKKVLNSNVEKEFVEKTIDNHLNPVKKYTIDPRNENFVQPVNILKTLAELNISRTSNY